MSLVPAARRGTLADLLWLAAGSMLLFALLLGARDLWNPNEPLYGQGVVEMAQRGAWLVPTVNGETFLEKPILYYWLALISAKLSGGVDELTLRLPSALAGVISVLLVYLLVEPYAGRLRARLAAVMLATTYGVFWAARSVQMDLLLTVCVLGAILAATRVLDHGLAPWRGLAIAGAALGLGFLAKGPVALVCAGLPLVLYAAATRRLAFLATRWLLLGVVAFALVAVPWFALLWAGGHTDAIVEMLYRQNVTRFHDPWDHQAPWWYFLMYFWIDMAPWSLFVPLALGRAQGGERERRLELLAWLWIAALIAFFSLSQSKRSPYVLPLSPAVAILAAGVVAAWIEGTLERGRAVAFRALCVSIGLLLAGAGLYVGLEALPRYPLLGGAGTGTVVLLLAGGLATAMATVVTRRRWAAPSALFVSVFVLFLWAGAAALPAANAYKSARPFGDAVNRRVGPDDTLRAYRLWKWRASYTYYTRRRIPSLESQDELRAYWSRPERVFLIVERGLVDEARAVVGDVEPLEARPIGANFAYLFANR